MNMDVAMPNANGFVHWASMLVITILPNIFSTDDAIPVAV